jgi:hypothetical protein
MQMTCAFLQIRHGQQVTRFIVLIAPQPPVGHPPTYLDVTFGPIWNVYRLCASKKVLNSPRITMSSNNEAPLDFVIRQSAFEHITHFSDVHTRTVHRSTRFAFELCVNALMP